MRPQLTVGICSSKLISTIIRFFAVIGALTALMALQLTYDTVNLIPVVVGSAVNGAYIA